MNQSRMFRQHDVAPTAVTSPIYRQLTQDWAYLHGLASTPVTVRRWGRLEPALAMFERPGDIVDAIDRSDTTRKNELLLALLRLFQDNQQLAGRTVLQALLPKLAKIAHSTARDDGNSAEEPTRHDGRSVDDNQVTTIAEFWYVMAHYPVHRRTERVASNLALDTLNRVTGQRQEQPAIPADPTLLASSERWHESGTGLASRIIHGSAQDTVVDPDPTEVITPDSDLIDVIAWAARTSAITTDEAKLLVTVYLTDETPEGWQTTDGRRAPAVIRKRCSRAIRKLTAAVREEMTSPLALSPEPVVHAVA